ncbi:hypothetical protein [Anseongella ginsenosidimutans]|uniref:hypothetical protein n=1 Tax=Anseongella ginsenosidimutans TaxID=496056 RepID=UPI001CEF72AD|nr:hypothetical protein [Anseongella ginsenosidimutans]
MKFQRYFWIIIFLSAAQAGYAQRTLEEQINVVRAYRPVLADAVKIRKNPQLSDTNQVRPRLNYLVTDEKLSDNSNPGPVPAKQPRAVTNGFIPYLYGKAGAGNLGGVLGEIYFNNKQDENNQYGLFFQHNSAKGDFDYQQYGRTAVGGFGKFNIGERASLNVNAAYRQRGNRISVLNGPLDITDPDVFPIPTAVDTGTVKQNFNLLEGEVEIANLRTTSSDFVYGLKLGGYTLSDEFESKENNFYLTGLIGKQLGTFSINLSGNIDITNLDMATAGGGEVASVKNPVYRFKPYLLFKNGSFTFKGGINLVGISDDNAFAGIDKKMFLFPDLSIDFQLIPDYLALFGGLSGDVVKNTVKDFSEENPYMRNFSGLGNSREKYNAFGGIRGSFSSSVGFKAQFEYANVDYQNFIVNDTLNSREFSVYQAGENGKRTTINAELNVRYSEAFRMNMGVWSYKYEDDFIQRAWNVPSMKLYISPTYNYRDKLFLTADLFYVGERNAYLGPPAKALPTRCWTPMRILILVRATRSTQTSVFSSMPTMY